MITLAPEMCVQFTGTPNHGSAEPHLPGPTRIYGWVDLSFLLYDSISLEILIVFSVWNVLGLTKIAREWTDKYGSKIVKKKKMKKKKEA